MRNGFALCLSLAMLGGALVAGGGTPAAQVMAVNGSAVEGDGPGMRMPRALSDYGFFVDGAGQTPAAGVTPYRLNTPLYSDGADKLRFLYLPDGEQAIADGENLLDIPVGGALIKTFAFGQGADRRLIETRVLLHRADGWLALPYRWNAEQTEAKLALAGARLELETPAGDTLSYRIPNKNQCKECHGFEGAVVPIGPKARNLSGEWLAAMAGDGRLDAVPDGHDTLPVWENWREASAESAARAYLDVNCAHCHRPAATASNSGLDLRWEQTDLHALGILKRPVAAGRGSAGFQYDVVPGRPHESILLHRMQTNETGVAMPELGKATVDAEGVAAVERWIAGL